MNNNNNNNLARNGTGEDTEEGKAVQDNCTSRTTTATTTTYQQTHRRFPEHTTVGTLTSSSTSYTWNNNKGNSNNNNTMNNNRTMTTYNNNKKSLPLSSSWMNDPEIKRQKRIVKYKSYAVEGKMKASIRNGFRWVKNKALHGQNINPPCPFPPLRRRLISPPVAAEARSAAAILSQCVGKFGESMSKALLGNIRRASSLLQSLSFHAFSVRSILQTQESILSTSSHLGPLKPRNPPWVLRNWSHGTVNLVISQGKPKFETHEVDPPKKEKWQTKKRLKLRRKTDKQKRKAANKRDPRHLTIKGKKKKQRFANAEERINYKLEKAKIKEALLIERLKRYEVPKLQGPVVKPHILTGEERFYLKKMAQKGSNYAPIGRRGVFGGVILNMHMHWKKHETVKVFCKPCKPGQVHEYAEEISRLSGGIPIQIIGDDTIIFYRGKNYVQPEIMSPIDTLSKKRALEKSKYEQSLETVRRFIAMAEKELELYYRHLALYGDPNNRNPISILEGPTKVTTQESRKLNMLERKSRDSPSSRFSPGVLETEGDSTVQELLSELEDDIKDEGLSSTSESDSDYEDSKAGSSSAQESSSMTSGSSSTLGNVFEYLEQKM
ncbi:hypothetical protein LWI28_017407 [Acer negundo]|uniref:CRM domain-containing protein n=1 Tax=Acer negundo TaxID=4023 RepID=A0AAD5P225_ACENE|nr:hypothetical protein LWI28_017407 [Acer negundo]